MQDLSHLARNGPWVTSQAAGNMTASNAGGMDGPGSAPVDPEPASQGDPAVATSDTRPVGTPPARITTGGYAPSPAMWKATG